MWHGFPHRGCHRLPHRHGTELARGTGTAGGDDNEVRGRPTLTLPVREGALRPKGQTFFEILGNTEISVQILAFFLERLYLCFIIHF